MFLQGNLQTMFDALYAMGVIDPVLEMDWGQALEEMEDHKAEYFQAIQTVNSTQGDLDQLIGKLGVYDEKTLSYLAMEIAKEFAEYHSRGDLQ